MRHLKLAAEVAANDRKTRRKNYLFACVIKRKDGAVVVSQNATTRIPEPALHAEARALRKADRGCVMYVARVTRDGAWAMAKPCASCQALIRSRGVKRVFYTIAPNEWGVWEVSKEKTPT